MLTRQCLQVLAEFRNPVTIVTKNHLVTRDIDILTRLARCKAVMVNLSVTTLDPQLGRAGTENLISRQAPGGDPPIGSSRRSGGSHGRPGDTWTDRS